MEIEEIKEEKKRKKFNLLAKLLKTTKSKIIFIIVLILIVIIATAFDTLNGNTMAIRNVIIYMFIANEGISVLENLSQIGILIPNILKNKLETMGDEKNEQNNKSNL